MYSEVIMEEIWKDIPEFNGIYQASNFGRIRSFYKNKFGRILTLTKKENGYLTVRLITGRKYVHRLIYESFIGNIPQDYEINHIDMNKSNNRPDNIECVTHKENMESASKKHNIDWIKKPSLHNQGKNKKLPSAEILIELRKQYDAQTIADKYGVTRKAVYKAYKRIKIHNGRMNKYIQFNAEKAVRE